MYVKPAEKPERDRPWDRKATKEILWCPHQQLSGVAIWLLIKHLPATEQKHICGYRLNFVRSTLRYSPSCNFTRKGRAFSLFPFLCNRITAVISSAAPGNRSLPSRVSYVAAVSANNIISESILNVSRSLSEQQMPYLPKKHSIEEWGFHIGIHF